MWIGTFNIDLNRKLELIRSSAFNRIYTCHGRSTHGGFRLPPPKNMQVQTQQKLERGVDRATEPSVCKKFKLSLLANLVN